MLAGHFLTVGVLLFSAQPAEPLLGCHDIGLLARRIDELRQADWLSLDRTTFLESQASVLDATERDPESQQFVVFERSGRIIDGELECGERYLFHSPVGGTGDYLKEVYISHAEVTRAAALRAAESLAAAVRSPPGAGPVNQLCLDCGDPGERVVDREWTDGDVINTLQVFLREGTKSFIVSLAWSRRWGSQ